MVDWARKIGYASIWSRWIPSAVETFNAMNTGRQQLLIERKATAASTSEKSKYTRNAMAQIGNAHLQCAIGFLR